MWIVYLTLPYAKLNTYELLGGAIPGAHAPRRHKPEFRTLPELEIDEKNASNSPLLAK
jgi:hypothetical protein